MGEGHDQIERVEISAAVAETFGLRSAVDGGVLFCGVSEEQFAINGVTYQWPRGSHLTWGLGFSRLGSLSDMDVKDVVTAALKEIAEACDVTHEYRKNVNGANFHISTRRLDGPSGVLADCQIPTGNVDVDGTQLLMRLDDSEAWGIFDNPPANKIDLYRVILHEFLHGHGLGHQPTNAGQPALIAPMYSRSIRHLQPADKAELVRRYGRPRNVDPVGPAPTPAPAGKCEIESLVIRTPDGKRYSAKGVANPLALILEE